MQPYHDRVQLYTSELEQINKKYNTISLLRLCSVLGSLVGIFYAIKTGENIFIGIAIILAALFIVLMRMHTKLSWQKKLKQALIKVNKDEISYLSGKSIPFDNGAECNDFQHPYAYDLDVFGENSLFQNLNRTQTYIGKQTLAKLLLTLLPNEEILRNQEAVKELAEKIDWRQDSMASAKVNKDSKELYETVMNWSTKPSEPVSKVVQVLSYIMPVGVLGSIVAYQFINAIWLVDVITIGFVFNLLLLGSQTKKIKNEIHKADSVHQIIHQYSLIVQKIEQETFVAPKLKELQQKLGYKNQKASTQITKLAELFSRMDSMANVITTVLFNGLFLFHVHTLRALIQWKKDHAANIKQWLDVIGEMEALHSLGNLSHNNPDFCYPTLNTNYEIVFKDLTHPLLNAQKRIGNDVTFQPQSFMILTGSNMSGKSTFLRSLGVNMVLTGIGSPVCATEATVHPLPVLVSMRLSDSLSDSESYFFAEIKRLKQIMDELAHQRAFVLLDEILRGTNSDDKRSGTIAVVKKMIDKQAIGAIATHDIEVCLTTNEYPAVLINKCFEVEIINNDLFFDYKLRDGICKNKSATFLMQKMGVI
ncbi:MutS-related protein [Flavobacterium sp. '19STA2R22 D10 B1']|uniref:MutS-related protein n=1 Tax=Flavobacterium aerium TaxID=3037261 RepID=UPI00278BDD37|nr:DNA mismatch repair protein [Flavobacterium sp. '19STA2R22 D10 B1']